MKRHFSQELRGDFALISGRAHMNARLTFTCSDVCRYLGDQRMAFEDLACLKRRGGPCVLFKVSPSYGLVVQATHHELTGSNPSTSSIKGPIFKDIVFARIRIPRQLRLLSIRVDFVWGRGIACVGGTHFDSSVSQVV